jgi:hypothetical protein
VGGERARPAPFSLSESGGAKLMFAALLAARTTWIGAVFVLLGLGVLYLFFRAIVDFFHWFHEEIIEDFREGRKKKRNAKDKR